jgi:hypothetical protein
MSDVLESAAALAICALSGRNYRPRKESAQHWGIVHAELYSPLWARHGGMDPVIAATNR